MDNGTQTGTAPDTTDVSSAAPTTASPSTSSQPTAPASTPAATPTDVGTLPTNTATPGAALNPAPAPTYQPGTWDKITAALQPKKNQHVDPNTGEVVGDPNYSRKSLAAGIVAAALVGMMKGLAAPPGRGHEAAAVGAGLQTGLDMANAPTEQAKENADRQGVLKARALDLNLKQLQLQKQQADMDEESHGKTVDLYAQQLSDAIEDNPTAVIAQHVSEQDAADVRKYPASSLRIPDGYVPKPGGGFQQTFTILDANTQVPISDWAGAAKEWNVPGADKIPAEGSVSALTSGHYTHAVATLEATQSELDDEAAKLGTKAVDLKSEMQKNPGLLSAILQFQKSSWASVNPDEQISAMKQDKRAAPYAPYIEQLFGGAQNLKNLNALRTMDDAHAQQIVDAPDGQYPKPLVDAAKARVTNAETRAQQVKDTEERHKQDIDLPAKEQDQRFQASLIQQKAALDKQAADANGRNLKADEMTTKEANDRDTDLTAIAGVQNQLNMAKGGNEQAMADAKLRFAEHEVKAGGMGRFNETERKALGGDVGTWGRQIEAWYAKGADPKQAPNVTFDEMNSVLNLEKQQRNDLYSSHVQNIDQHIRVGGTGGGPATPQKNKDGFPIIHP